MYKFQVYLSHPRDDDTVVQEYRDALKRGELNLGTQVREYQRPCSVTRFLENSIGGVQFAVLVLFKTELIASLLDEEWLDIKVCHESKDKKSSNARKSLSCDEYFRRLIKDQHQFEQDSERRLQNQSQIGTEATTKKYA